MSETVNLQEARERLGELVTLVARGGDEVLIVTDDGVSAKLVPAAARRRERRVAGLHAGAMIAAADFDEPLPDEFWAANLEAAARHPHLHLVGQQPDAAHTVGARGAR